MEQDQSRTKRPLGRRTAHLCVDMQVMFAEDTEWRTPWMKRVLPVVERIARHRPQSTIFTRFMPPPSPEGGTGAWRDYFSRWHQFTADEIDPALLELVPSLKALAPPATVVDKPAYSPFVRSPLQGILEERGIDTLVVTGAETDVCVLAAVLSAMDAGYHVIVAGDALCSSSDETHDGLMRLYDSRFSQQVEMSDSARIIASWAEEA